MLPVVGSLLSLLLANLNFAVHEYTAHTTLVVEVAEAAGHGIDFLVLIVVLMVDCGSPDLVLELELIDFLNISLFLIHIVLVLDDNLELAVFADHHRDLLGESIERIQLLLHEPICLEVPVQHLPHLALVGITL